MKSKIQKIFSIPLIILLNKAIKFPFKPILKKIKTKEESKIIIDYLNFTQNINPNYNLKLDANELFSNNNLIQLEEIENILKHRFDLLGSGLVRIGYDSTYTGFLGNNYSKPIQIVNYSLITSILPPEHIEFSNKVRELISKDYIPIDWFVDFRCGYRWDCKYYDNIKYGNIESADIKVPWELSRLYHIFDLSLCCKLLDDNYKSIIVKEIQNQLLDFISMNPPFYGPNWVSPMEVSIRSFNIIMTLLELRRNSTLLDNEAMKYVINYLWASYEFLKHHNEWNDGLRNNHYFANLLGLSTLSKFLYYELEREYQADLYKHFRQELNTQFFDDGGNFEGSIPYHFFTFEIVYWLSSLYLDEIIKDPKVQSKLIKILKFNSIFAQQNTEYFQIGDNDSGNILKTNCLSRLYNKYFIISHNLFKHITNKDLQTFSEAIFEIFGIIALNQHNCNLIISLGRKAQLGKGGHNHNDAQSFILLIDNKPIFVDTGTFVYTASPIHRNRFRSANMHNKLNNSNKFEFLNHLSELFWFNDYLRKFNYSSDSNKTIIDFKDNQDFFNRKYIFENKLLSIIDLINQDVGEVQSNFHLHPQCKISRVNGTTIKIVNENIELYFQSSSDVRIESYDYSPEYGKIIQSQKIVISVNSNKTNKLEYIISY